MNVKKMIGAFASLAWMLCLCAHAGSYTWTGGGAAGNWNDADNWSPSTGTPGVGFSGCSTWAQ